MPRFGIEGELSFIDAGARERAVTRFLAATDGVVDTADVRSTEATATIRARGRVPAVLFGTTLDDLEALARAALSGKVEAARDDDAAVVTIAAGGTRETLRDLSLIHISEPTRPY